VNDIALQISGEQTIHTADELHKELADYLAQSEAVIVDLSGVDECDTAALQLICALRLSTIERKQRFEIIAISPAITETAAALGFRLDELSLAWEPAGEARGL
jgi:anti-sigma B factor antagonist